MKKGFIFFFVLFPLINGIAQNRIGTWKSHLPYSNASKIVIAGNKIYCATDGGLFYYDKSDNSIEKFSKENGLSDTEISALGYSEKSGITVIAYNNANIDLIQDNLIFNLPDIMRYTQILGDKRINSIMILEPYAYLSTAFGIVVINLERKEIADTYIIGEAGSQINVNSTCFDGQFFYAATNQGIYKASVSDSLRLQNYNYWKRISDIPNFNKKFSNLVVVKGIVFTSVQNADGSGDIVYDWDGVSWNTFKSLIGDYCTHLSEWNGKLVFTTQYNTWVLTTNVDLVKSLSTGSPRNSFMDKDSVLWIADSEKGLIQNPDESTLNIISPNGPSTIFVSDIAISGNILYTVPGGLNTSGNNQFRNGEINTFKENKWTGYKRTEYKDFYRIAIDPEDAEHYFVASWGWGLFEYQKDSLLKVYRDDNSSLQTVIPGDYFRLGGMTFDTFGNLWVSNASVAEPLSVFIREEGKVKKSISFSLKNLVNSPFTGDIIETQTGYKWMLLTPGRGIIAIDDNGTIENTDDDRYARFDVKDINNAIITNDVYAIAEDKDGNIWLGTNKGVLVYYNPSGVFDGDNFYAQQVLVPRNDGSLSADALLGTESVTSIAIDGGNRKWLGTKNAGLSLVSDDGLTLIHNFTAENSPLLSNSITSIAVNDKNGEVFIGSDKGIISYVADATGPAEDFESVFVYPNPVRENFTGDVAITGLMENSTVKITDLNGNICFEKISLGGQVLWDGKNFSGEKVGTGIYLVFCSSEDGSLSKVTKLLFIH